ncbi:type IX secretion system outer membrane channel protein PorV [Desertivirga xinjiangensis]|uniref:type IX secretion system outer membrane channel protein PorV n=1 Tax=Desertivirga xinjiangensis TaxID=539206 RepID=UPI002108CBF3|nr:type IX secretion system outer membrane channel protein PorV [Pedobacter xinjiangensis]
MITNYRTKVGFVLLVAFALLCYKASAQGEGVGGDPETTTDGRTGSRLIQAGVPFLLIAPDSRSGGMGEAGVAVSPDANSIHWNPSKLAFIDGPAGLSLSYSPWLQRLVPDINLAYLTGFYRLDDRNVIGGSLRYFSLGDIEFRQTGEEQATIYSPNEFAIDATFARQFGENFSLGTALRFIRSNLGTNLVSGTGAQTKAGTALAADVSAFFKKETILLGNDARLAAGLNISNIGNKMSYVEGDDNKVFLPTNLRIGGAATFFPDALSELTVILDINKLLIPSPPVTVTEDGNTTIVSGRDPSNLSVPAAIFGSFNDAPGGFKEEMQELSYSTGLEYRYNKQFALRAGYIYEHPEKGNRNYLTLGAGLKYNVLNLDFAYILANQEKSPLANTLRFTLLFNFIQK